MGKNLSRIKLILGLIFLIIFGIFINFPLLKPKIKEIKAYFEEELESPQFLTIQSNSLLPISEPSPSEAKVIKKIKVIITGYSSTLRETDDTPYLTANGKLVEEGIVANNLLAFGTKIRMPEIYGDKIFTIEDRMHRKKGKYHVDIWFPSHQEALDFGAKTTYIEILES